MALALLVGQVAQAQPANDDCDNPTPLSLGVEVNDSNLWQSLPYFDHDPTQCGERGVDVYGQPLALDFYDLWYSFRAPSAGWYKFSLNTHDSDVAGALDDLVLSLFTNCNSDAVACASWDASTPSPQSVFYQFSANQTILVRVGTGRPYDLQGRSYTITATAITAPVTPANDLCSTAVPLTITVPANAAQVPYYSTTYTISDLRGATLDQASVESGDSTFGDRYHTSCSTITYGVWYKVTMPGYGVLGIVSGNLGNVNNLRHFPFIGNDCAHLADDSVAVGCSSNVIEDSLLSSYKLRAGTTLYVLLGSANYSQAQEGPYNFQFYFLPETPPSGACCIRGACQVKTIVDCEAAGGIFVGENRACADGVTRTSSTPIALNSTVVSDDGSKVYFPLAVPDNGTAESITVTLDVIHSYASDVRFDLQAPTGTEVSLIGRAGPDGECLGPTDVGANYKLDGVYVFDDSAPTGFLDAALALAPGSVLPPGRYKPAVCIDAGGTQLSDFYPAAINGTWSLGVIDRSTGTGATGTLRSWSINFNGGSGHHVCACPADIDKNGTVNVSDIFAFLRAWFARTLPAADFDGNGTINVSDIFAFLRSWFAHC